MKERVTFLNAGLRKTTTMKLHLPASIIAFVCSLGLWRSHAGEQVFFAFDDHTIPWQQNLKVTLVPATKHPGNPVLRRGPEGAPDHGHAVLYGTVIKDGDKFRMWYLGMIETEIKAGNAPGWWRPMCYAESADGVHWTKPELGLVELNGNRRNNICLVEGEPFVLTRVDDFLSVLYEPGDPDPARRYKTAYIAHPHYEDIRGGMSKVRGNASRLPVTICATSADGLSWKVVGDRPADAGGESFEVSSLYRFGDFYFTTGQSLAGRADGSEAAHRSMRVYRSPDFVKWSQATALAFARPGQLTNPPVTGQQNHMGAGLWNRGNVLVGLYGMWQDAETPPAKGESFNKGVHIDLGLIVSNDGVHFREPVPNFKVLARGQPGEWDDIALLQGNAFVNEGDQTLIWYSHWDTSGKLKSMDIGLATMRRDGFGYLSGIRPETDAELITAFFTAEKGGRLLLNVDGVAADAPLTVELLDGRAAPLAGWSGTDAATITANGTRQEVVWPRTKTASLPDGQPLAARVKLPAGSKAHLFALYVGD